jgi:hypothetical protein
LTQPLDPDIVRLAELIRLKNEADARIAEMIGRPALSGNIGEFVASRIFDVELMKSGIHPGHDGVFRSGRFAGKTVNIKAYARHERILDVGRHPRDYYLVLTGPDGPGKDPRWGICSVFLLDGLELDASIARRGVQIGVATSVPKAEWEAARVFPVTESSPLPLSDEQAAMLEALAP